MWEISGFIRISVYYESGVGICFCMVNRLGTDNERTIVCYALDWCTKFLHVAWLVRKDD